MTVSLWPCRSITSHCRQPVVFYVDAFSRRHTVCEKHLGELCSKFLTSGADTVTIRHRPAPSGEAAEPTPEAAAAREGGA